MKTEVLLSTCVGMLGLLASWKVLAPRHRLTTSSARILTLLFMGELDTYPLGHEG